MARYPTAFGRLLGVLDRLEAPRVEVVVVGRPDDDATRSLLTAALARFDRNRTVAGWLGGVVPPGIPLLEGKTAVGGSATAYVCRGYVCRAPVTDAAALEAELRAAGGDGG
jgi:hypothetical protein